MDNPQPGDQVTVEYTDGTEATFTVPEPWAPYGTAEYIRQIAGDDPPAQAMVRSMIDGLRQWSQDGATDTPDQPATRATPPTTPRPREGASMPKFRITVDAYNSRPGIDDTTGRVHPTPPPLRLSVVLTSWCAEAARRRLTTIYVSRDQQLITLDGGVGADGYSYPEWQVVSTRRVPDHTPVTRGGE